MTPEQERWIRDGEPSKDCSCGGDKCFRCCPCYVCQDIRRQVVEREIEEVVWLNSITS